MIVESHSHVVLDMEGVGESMYQPYGAPMEGLKQYLQTYDGLGVDACWVFGAWGWRDTALIRPENDALARLRQEYPGRLFPWGSVNPNWPEHSLRAEIRRLAADLGLYGIKLVPVMLGVPLSCRAMDIVAEEAVAHGLPIFFHDGSPEYCSAVQVAYYARRHPDLRVVSGHGGLRELWPDVLRAAEELPNLWICLSGPTQWAIQRFYDALGPEKLLFGSDGGLGHPAIVKAYLRRIDSLQAPPEHKRMILGENAMRFLFGPDGPACPIRNRHLSNSR